MWSESLTHVQIVQRAKEVASPIHPDDGPSQMRILLRKLDEAIQAGNGKIELSQNQGLELRLKTPLPGGLGDLNWRLSLECLPASAMRKELIGPMAALLYAQKQQMNQLARLLNEKDNVIGRILDKVDSMGLEYETIFPNARFGKSGDQREQAVKHVRGLAPFNKERWRYDCDSTDMEAESTSKVLDQAFDGISSRGVRSLVHNLNLGAGEVADRDAEIVDIVAERHSTTKVSQVHSQYHADEFQRQTTPERTKRLTATPDEAQPSTRNENISQTAPDLPFEPTLTMDMGDDATTEDEDDLDGPFQKQNKSVQDNFHGAAGLQPQSTTPGKQTSEVAATLRNRGRDDEGVTPPAHASPSSSPSSISLPNTYQQDPNSPSLKQKMPKEFSDIGLSKVAEDATSPMPSATSTRTYITNPTALSLAPGRKLGSIGSRRNAKPDDSTVPDASHDTDDASENHQSPATAADGAASTVPKRKLGRIGGLRHPHNSDTGSNARAERGQPNSHAADNAAPINVSSPTVAEVSTAPGAKRSAATTKKADDAAASDVEPSALEKADLKREKLRKDLEEAKPVVKKRRKF